MKRATSHVDGLTRVELFGLDFVDDTSIARVADLVLDSTPDDVEGHPVIVTPNTDLLLQVVKTPDSRIREFFAKAWCVLPDGQPIVWASRLLGSRLRFRLGLRRNEIEAIGDQAQLPVVSEQARIQLEHALCADDDANLIGNAPDF